MFGTPIKQTTELKKGGGNKPNAAEALSDEKVNILYERSLLGISTAEALMNTLWLFNSVHFRPERLVD